MDSCGSQKDYDELPRVLRRKRRQTDGDIAPTKSRECRETLKESSSASELAMRGSRKQNIYDVNISFCCEKRKKKKQFYFSCPPTDYCKSQQETGNLYFWIQTHLISPHNNLSMQTIRKSGLYLFVLAAICSFKGESVGLDGTGSQRMTRVKEMVFCEA